jgi:hypothetical protein
MGIAPASLIAQGMMGIGELAIEVTSAQSGVVAVGQAERIGVEALSSRAQDACLADAKLAGEHDAGARLESLQDVVDDLLFRRG